jgi:hypothetical protein
MKRILFALTVASALLGGVAATTLPASAAPARHLVYYNISVDSACKWEYNPGASADLRSYNGSPANADPYAWFCTGGGVGHGPVDLNRWCAHLNEGHAVLVAYNAYGWRCER